MSTQPQSTQAIETALAPSRPQVLDVFPMKRIDGALQVLRRAGIPIPASSVADKPLAHLMSDMVALGEQEVIAIARTLGNAEIFNELVRNELQQVSVGERYNEISKNFDSIRDDAKKMVEQLSDGRIDFREKVSNLWMTVSRGSIPSRFTKIKGVAEEVFEETQNQLTRERTILDAYREFRVSIKEASIIAESLVARGKEQLDAAQAELVAAQSAVDTAPDTGSDRSRAELARDHAIATVQMADRRYQTALDLLNNLVISYNTGDVVMARLVQTSEAKERVWRQSVTFFNTNESVLTALSATFTSTAGLHEATQTHEQLKAGMNRSLETLADIGGQVQENALRAGYGPTTEAASVKRLVESIVTYQEKSRTIVREMREAAEKNTAEIKAAVEDGKRRLTELEAQAAREGQA